MRSESEAHTISLSTSMVDDKVRLVVTDTGPPLAAAGEHSAALEPFYGGGSLTEGPGLHLTLAREVIDRHGGELSLSSDERGNRLEAILPPAPDGTRAALVDKPGR